MVLPPLCRRVKRKSFQRWASLKYSNQSKIAGSWPRILRLGEAIVQAAKDAHGIVRHRPPYDRCMEFSAGSTIEPTSGSILGDRA
jgi:hypothetical protein